MSSISYQLYELSARYQALIDKIAEQEGELTEEDEQELNITEDNLSEAISESYKAIKNIKNVISGLEQEKDGLDKRIKRYKKIVDRISENLKMCMLTTGHTDKTYGTDHHYAYITYTHPVEVNEEVALGTIQKPLEQFKAAIPGYFKVSVSVSKSDIGKLIDNGETFDYAMKGENANINIK